MNRIAPNVRETVTPVIKDLSCQRSVCK